MRAHQIMVVEDNPQNRKLARTILHLAGYQTLEAADAAEAIDLLDDNDPDLILMDIQIPGMDGVALTRLLRKRGATQDTPIIALTAYAMKGDHERFLHAGCDGYISKPIDPGTLPNVVDAYLGDPGVRERKGALPPTAASRSP